MYLAYLLIGLLTGVVSGFLGVGGAVIMIPAFIFWFGLSQHQAQGTSLAAMLAPVFLLAVLRYYYEGHVNVPMAVIVAVGITAGGLIGAHYAQVVPAIALKRVFGIYLIVIGIRMAFFR
ncbi:MAG: sulfite exporter TauE/SafE family protein [Candidatus Omnitrophota bacterium]